MSHLPHIHLNGVQFRYICNMLCFFFLPLLFFCSSPDVVVNANPSFVSGKQLYLLPYQFFPPASILHTSDTVFGKGSFFWRTSFSIYSSSLPYFCLSALYGNSFMWCYSFTVSSALHDRSLLGLVTFTSIVLPWHLLCTFQISILAQYTTYVDPFTGWNSPVCLKTFLVKPHLCTLSSQLHSSLS